MTYEPTVAADTVNEEKILFLELSTFENEVNYPEAKIVLTNKNTKQVKDVIFTNVNDVPNCVPLVDANKADDLTVKVAKAKEVYICMANRFD